jgi:hypothetical protein
MFFCAKEHLPPKLVQECLENRVKEPDMGLCTIRVELE